MLRPLQGTSLTLLLAVLAPAIGLRSDAGPTGADPGPSWNRKAAAGYLDQRTSAWMHGGAMDHETFCISCHTALPYALARSSLRAGLGETAPSQPERQLLESVSKRVRLWNEVQPYLSNKTEGPATESVINALVLVSYDGPQHRLSAEARQALNVMWSTQLKQGAQAGAWPWFGDWGGGNEPWEGPSSQYWGATLAAATVGMLPAAYRSAPDIQPHVAALRTYLRQAEPNQSLLNRLSLLWAAGKLPGLLSADQKAAIVKAILARQQPDGGWSTTDLDIAGWKRHDGSAQETRSDGYATGLAAFVLPQAGLPSTRSAVKAARLWLLANQDGATAYAVLALTGSG